jgi:predicted nucleotidyltransferase
LQNTNTTEIYTQIKKEITSKLNHVNQCSRNYISDVITLIKNEIGIEKITSIILFGSQNSNNHENTFNSDCDLLIVFDNSVSNRNIRNVEKYFMSLEVKHHFREFNYTIAKKVLEVVQQTTGMFISHFMTQKRYWQKANFQKIFRVNEVFTFLFAPSKIVLCSVIDNSTLLYGEDSREEIKNKINIPFHDMIKSIIMNLMISIFSIVISPFSSLNSIKYDLESVKWALRASNYYSYEDSESLKSIITRFLLFEKPWFKKRAEKFYSKFLQLRINPKLDMSFMLRVPFRILKIHLKGLLLKNFNRETLKK